ncbi:unnamed protein product [Vitrella brassicaformis CCMP3155]|uniref:Uncharacterized protein n=1 Tax=Vitrella brassicaformis (strain CCMP3155) TaxID=1169540 RepID=A0A0G4ELT0_VITBC|nr:unnamed protein product [Vitrella brassicaformis CCMP3155]|eukprot:CEL97788.1 unnamed protein product [Vitrella brassicaformis CCMP3155]
MRPGGRGEGELQRQLKAALAERETMARQIEMMGSQIQQLQHQQQYTHTHTHTHLPPADNEANTAATRAIASPVPASFDQKALSALPRIVRHFLSTPYGALWGAISSAMSDVSYSLARGDADGAVEVGEQLDRLVRGVEGGDLEWMAPEGGKDSSRAAADQQLYFDFRRLSDLTSAMSFA